MERERPWEDLGVGEGGSGMEGMTSRRLDAMEIVFGKVGCGEADFGKVQCGRDSGLDFLGKVLSSWDTCHHPDAGQSLTTTNNKSQFLRNIDYIKLCKELHVLHSKYAIRTLVNSFCII